MTTNNGIKYVKDMYSVCVVFGFPLYTPNTYVHVKDIFRILANNFDAAFIGDTICLLFGGRKPILLIVNQVYMI